MSALNLLSSLAGPAPSGGNGLAAPVTGNNAVTESFDQVMGRTMAPSNSENDAADASPELNGNAPAASGQNYFSSRPLTPAASPQSNVEVASTESNPDDLAENIPAVTPERVRSKESAGGKGEKAAPVRTAARKSEPTVDPTNLAAIPVPGIELPIAMRIAALTGKPGGTGTDTVSTAVAQATAGQSEQAGKELVAHLATEFGKKDAARSAALPAESSSASALLKPGSAEEAKKTLAPAREAASSAVAKAPETPAQMTGSVPVKVESKIETPVLAHNDMAERADAGSNGGPGANTNGDTHGEKGAKGGSTAGGDLSVDAPDQPGGNGTINAQLDTAMKKTENMDKVAGLSATAGKDFPAIHNSSAPGKDLPAADALAGSSMVPGNSASASISTTGVAATVGETSPRWIEHASDMIAVQAVRQMDAGADTLRVTIKPADGLELALEVRQHGGAVDARAVLQQGNFSELNHHWPELQQRLEQRGVRLAPLTGNENSTAGGGSQDFQQSSRNQNGRDPIEAGAVAELAPARPSLWSSSPTAAQPAAAGHRGWQTWA